VLSVTTYVALGLGYVIGAFELPTNHSPKSTLPLKLNFFALIKIIRKASL
jgi:hypothetical protein